MPPFSSLFVAYHPAPVLLCSTNSRVDCAVARHDPDFLPFFHVCVKDTVVVLGGKFGTGGALDVDHRRTINSPLAVTGRVVEYYLLTRMQNWSPGPEQLARQPRITNAGVLLSFLHGGVQIDTEQGSIHNIHIFLISPLVYALPPVVGGGSLPGPVLVVPLARFVAIAKVHARNGPVDRWVGTDGDRRTVWIINWQRGSEWFVGLINRLLQPLRMNSDRLSRKRFLYKYRMVWGEQRIIGREGGSQGCRLEN